MKAESQPGDGNIGWSLADRPLRSRWGCDGPGAGDSKVKVFARRDVPVLPFRAAKFRN
jgi:hypothetical protein